MSAASGRAVGIALCSNLLRGVLLDQADPTVTHAAEVALQTDDDRSLLDALTRLRAALGAAAVPARLATFPTGSWMRRVDVTGRSGPELNNLRVEIDRRHGASSTLLVDDGARRWLHILHWPDARTRRVESLAERAGFVDVAVEPSPIALARVIDRGATVTQRVATAAEATVTVVHAGMPVSAVSIDATGRPHPTLDISHTSFSVELFDDVTDADAIADLIDGVRQRSAGSSSTRQHADAGVGLVIDGVAVPQFPPHDLRAPERQCVAIGAAVGAAGLRGRVRPIDMITDAADTKDVHRRPWVIERVIEDEAPPNPGPSGARRALLRLSPRRRG